MNKSSVNPDGKVLSQLIPIHEYNDDVDLELNVELIMQSSGARIDLREQHIQRDLHLSDHISISCLNVLHLSGKCLSLECLNSHKLHFNGLNHILRFLNDNVTIEWLIESAVYTVDLSLESELRDSLGSSCLQSIRCDLEVLRNICFPVLNVNASSLFKLVAFINEDITGTEQ
jgi:hypothetical protein